MATLTSQMINCLADWKLAALDDRKLKVDGRSLTVSSLTALAHGRVGGLKVSEASHKDLEENHGFLKGLLDGGAVIYGINTGFGGSADVRCSDVAAVQKSLIAHLNAGFGEKVDSSVVRGAMAVRVNSLSLAYSGVRPEVVQLLCDMIHHDITPVVPLRGSVSASGDLMPLSYVAACMMGRPDSKVVMKEEEMTGVEAFRRAGLKPIEFEAKEALAVINAASVASSMAALVLFDVSIVQLLTQVVTGLCMEGLHGKMESFHEMIHSCLPHEGNQEVAANVRALLKQSKFVQHEMEWKGKDKVGSLKQDRYALRTAAQWLGPSLEMWRESVRRVTVELNSANDNPLIDHRTREVMHCGNFQGTSCTIAMDEARQAVQLCGRLVFAQLSEVLNHTMGHGLTPNLSGCDVACDFGFKGVDTATASYMSELNHVTTPLTNHVLSAEMHNQSVNSLALISARTTRTAVTLLQMILTNALCALCQAVDLRFLKNQVTLFYERILKDQSLGAKLPSELPCAWYELVFNPRVTLQNILHNHINLANNNNNGHGNNGHGNNGHGNNGNNGNNGFHHALEEELVLQMSALTRDLKAGVFNQQIAESMGTGTRNMYLYVRETLGVSYHDGSSPLDLSLSKIHDSITGRSIVNVLTDCFTN